KHCVTTPMCFSLSLAFSPLLILFLSISFSPYFYSSLHLFLFLSISFSPYSSPLRLFFFLSLFLSLPFSHRFSFPLHPPYSVSSCLLFFLSPSPPHLSLSLSVSLSSPHLTLHVPCIAPGDTRGASDCPCDCFRSI